MVVVVLLQELKDAQVIHDDVFTEDQHGIPQEWVDGGPPDVVCGVSGT